MGSSGLTKRVSIILTQRRYLLRKRHLSPKNEKVTVFMFQITFKERNVKFKTGFIYACKKGIQKLCAVAGVNQYAPNTTKGA